MCYNFNEFELKNPDVKKKTPKQLNQRKKETPPKEKQQKTPHTTTNTSIPFKKTPKPNNSKKPKIYCPTSKETWQKPQAK